MKRAKTLVSIVLTFALLWILATQLTKSPSPEEAKQALLELIADREQFSVMSQLEVSRLAKIPIEIDGSIAVWGPFRLDLRHQQYQLVSKWFGCDGVFERKGGRWVALPPHTQWMR